VATRYYPAVKAPNAIFHGGFAGTWANDGAFARWWAPVQWTWELSQTKVNAGQLRTLDNKCNQQPNYDETLWRMVTPPLEAQAVAGTIDLCFMVSSQFNNNGVYTADAPVRYKLHVYITVGSTTQVRHTLLNNYLDTIDWPVGSLAGGPGNTWTSLAAAQALTAGNTQAGDRIMVELGCRIVSSPAPAPTYVPTAWTEAPIRGTGTNSNLNVPFPDATAGSAVANLAPWIEFSANLTEQAVPAPPANDACADAIVIGATPYTSPWIDTTQSADTDRGVWWKWVCPTSGKVFVDTFGSNYGTFIFVERGADCATKVGEGSQRTRTALSQHRSQSNVCFDAVAGETYWISVTSDTTTSNAPQSGGLCRFSLWYRQAPTSGDLYLAEYNCIALRDGQLVNLTAGLSGTAPTSIGIDYTKRPMDDINGGQHTDYRLLVGLHNYDIVEILDLATMSYGDGQAEVDYISAPWHVVGKLQHPSQMVVTSDGILYEGWFGNGYLFVRGPGSLPAILNTVSNNVDYPALKIIDATFGDNQAAAPFADTLVYPAIEVTAPWAIELDEAAGILYYTSGGFYTPVGGQVIKRYDIANTAQLPDLATLALGAGDNPGLKGLALLSDGTLLVCNSPVVQRISAAGAVLQTYTPSIAEDSQSLTDIVLTPDGLSFYVVDEVTTRIFKFGIASGVEEATYQPYMEPGSLTQMVVFAPATVCPPLPSPCPAVDDAAVTSGKLCTAPNPTGCHATDAGG
jgi:hypothetical protein